MSPSNQKSHGSFHECHVLQTDGITDSKGYVDLELGLDPLAPKLQVSLASANGELPWMIFRERPASLAPMHKDSMLHLDLILETGELEITSAGALFLCFRQALEARRGLGLD